MDPFKRTIQNAYKASFSNTKHIRDFSHTHFLLNFHSSLSGNANPW